MGHEIDNLIVVMDRNLLRERRIHFWNGRDGIRGLVYLGLLGRGRMLIRGSGLMRGMLMVLRGRQGDVLCLFVIVNRIRLVGVVKRE
jgi:hypothetical protein